MFLVGSVLAVSGGLIRLITYRALGRFYTHSLGRCKGHALITSGPYSIVRHPGYSGFVMCNLGILAMHLSRGSWMRESGVMDFTGTRVLALMWILVVSAVSVSAVRRVNEEDRMMQDTFKVQWEEWAATVRYKLVPGVY
jgi:protein-S-isoprenylcysteine O-methyltransferase Ste14